MGCTKRIGVQDALALYTINAASIAFEELVKGSLETGKYGDVVVVAEDPFEVAAERIVDIPVEMTVIGGEIVYRQ
jgi:predicted amidohydrolase YtcJ